MRSRIPILALFLLLVASQTALAAPRHQRARPIPRPTLVGPRPPSPYVVQDPYYYHNPYADRGGAGNTR
jgi:hypothetical protein